MTLRPDDDAEINVVTGAFSYTGKYIAQRLLSMGKTVTTLTNHPQRLDPFRNQVQVHPYNFRDPHQLSESLQGASTLYNTYWIRFARGRSTFELAVVHQGESVVLALGVPVGGARVPLQKALGPAARVGNQQIQLSMRQLGENWMSRLTMIIQRFQAFQDSLQNLAAPQAASDE